MSIAQNPWMETCTHDRGPGTTVCLHCRYEARVAARARRQRLLLRVGASAIIVVTLTAGGVAAASAIRARGARSHDADSHAPVRTADATTSSMRQSSAASAGASASRKSQSQIGAAGHVVDQAPLAPVIPMGQSMLAAGVVAARTDSSVLVSFDAPMLRTRMPVKFEAFVRSTLPAIYGVGADSALSRLADGGIARQGDLLTELPTRGVRIPVRGGWTIALFPETRPGQDGPLVIRYRVSVIKG